MGAAEIVGIEVGAKVLVGISEPVGANEGAAVGT
jgi:hypothetical protein